MNAKAIFVILAVVICAGVAAVLSSANRAASARARAEAASAAADAASAEARKAEKDAQAEADRRRAAEAKKAEADASLEAAREARIKAEADERAALENRKAREAEAARARSDAEAAAAARDTARANAEAAREARAAAQRNAEAEADNARAEADRLAIERAKADKSAADAKLLELQRLDLVSFARELAERERDVAEREQALRPEKTIADLSWAGGNEDSVIDENGNVAKKPKKVYLAENDTSLPMESRILAKAERLRSEGAGESAKRVKEAVVASVEALYVAAIKEGRVVDAEFYRKTLKSMYPDWEFSLQAGAGEVNGKEQEK